jgi:hypothetical protein
VAPFLKLPLEINGCAKSPTVREVHTPGVSSFLDPSAIPALQKYSSHLFLSLEREAIELPADEKRDRASVNIAVQKLNNVGLADAAKAPELSVFIFRLSKVTTICHANKVTYLFFVPYSRCLRSPTE